MIDTNKLTEGSAATDCYLTFVDSPWIQISAERIARIDYPPVVTPLEREPFEIMVPRAICVVMVDGGELWSAGDRSWRERERQNRIDAAKCKLMNAEREYREALVG